MDGLLLEIASPFADLSPVASPFAEATGDKSLRSQWQKEGWQ